MFVDTYRSRIGFAPGTLTLCDQQVRAMEWDTASRDNNEAVWDKLVSLQNAGQACLTHDAFCKLLQDVKELTLRRITIGTDVATLEIAPYGNKSITLTLPGDQTFTCYATPRFEAATSQTVQVLHTALFFLSCQTLQDAEKKLAKMQMLGIATGKLT